MMELLTRKHGMMDLLYTKAKVSFNVSPTMSENQAARQVTGKDQSSGERHGPQFSPLQRTGEWAIVQGKCGLPGVCYLSIKFTRVKYFHQGT